MRVKVLNFKVEQFEMRFENFLNFKMVKLQKV